jgi:hypothetical protein
MFSKNSASSRAIPFEKMLKSVMENPFIPIAFQEDHKGMQGTVYLDNQRRFTFDDFKDSLNELFKNEWSVETLNLFTDMVDKFGEPALTLNEWWLKMRDMAVQSAVMLSLFDVTKQLCNRILEPFMYHTVLVTSTEWENFFYLRCPQYRLTPENGTIYRSRKEAGKVWNLVNGELSEIEWLMYNRGLAEIHMMALAEAMWDAYNESTPVELKPGEWHIPFGDNVDEGKLVELSPYYHNGIVSSEITDNEIWISNAKIKIATARCARVSYTVVGEEGKPDNYENDIKLHDRLSKSGHWSCFEHCAKAMSEEEYYNSVRGERDIKHTTQGNISTFKGDESFGWSGNFKGFIQYRKMFQNENIK